MQFSKISFVSEIEEYKFTPITGYQLEGITYKNVKYNKYIIIRYQLEYKNNISGENISCKINYFISDGHSNMFRANILFPFLCYSEMNKENPVCPTVFDSSRGLGILGGILKLRFLKNINESFIRNEFIKNRTKPFTLFYGDCGCDSSLPIENVYSVNGVITKIRSCKNCGKFISNINEHSATLTGIITSRLENLLDLIISVGSESIVNDVQYEKLVREPHLLTPVYTQHQEYNLDKYDGEDLKKHIKPVYLTQESNEYRRSILKTLKTILNLLTNKDDSKARISNPFTVELQTIEIKSISIDDFNKLDNVCKKINDNNTNLQHYITISNRLHETCKILCKDTFANDFLLENNKLTTYQGVNIFNDPVRTINLTWNSSCKLDTDEDEKWVPINIKEKLKADREERLQLVKQKQLEVIRQLQYEIDRKEVERQFRLKQDEIIKRNKMAVLQTNQKLVNQEIKENARYKAEHERNKKYRIVRTSALGKKSRQVRECRDFRECKEFKRSINKKKVSKYSKRKGKKVKK
jgi:hypothetical protein